MPTTALFENPLPAERERVVAGPLEVPFDAHAFLGRFMSYRHPGASPIRKFADVSSLDSAGAVSLSSYDLVKRHDILLLRMGVPTYATKLWHLATLLEKQSNGEPGPLTTERHHWNMFLTEQYKFGVLWVTAYAKPYWNLEVWDHKTGEMHKDLSVTNRLFCASAP